MTLDRGYWPPHTAVVVMGVSGSGKTTVARALAERLEGVFLDADDLHSQTAKQKMGAGTPLNDEDRLPWLNRVSSRIGEEQVHGSRVVIACSALRESYRDLLRASSGAQLVFVHLTAPPEILERRMTERAGHFMPASMLRSQLDTLEPLGPHELGAVIDVSAPSHIVVDSAAKIIASVE